MNSPGALPVVAGGFLMTRFTLITFIVGGSITRGSPKSGYELSKLRDDSACNLSQKRGFAGIAPDRKIDESSEIEGAFYLCAQ